LPFCGGRALCKARPAGPVKADCVCVCVCAGARRGRTRARGRSVFFLTSDLELLFSGRGRRLRKESARVVCCCCRGRVSFSLSFSFTPTQSRAEDGGAREGERARGGAGRAETGETGLSDLALCSSPVRTLLSPASTAVARREGLKCICVRGWAPYCGSVGLSTICGEGNLGGRRAWHWGVRRRDARASRT